MLTLNSGISAHQPEEARPPSPWISDRRSVFPMTVNIFLFQGRETKIVSEYVRTGQPSAFDTSGMIPPSVLQYNGSSDSGVRSAHW